jgi:multimeric flavodoxin WrbA
MKRLLIVWHSRTGATRAMAEAAAKGARGEPELETRMLTADEAQARDLLAADGYLFACPENLAAMSGAMKEFFDRNYYAVLGKLNGRPYAAMIAAGSDGAGAARQLARICTGWRLKPVAEPLIIGTHAQTPEAILAQKTLAAADLKACADLGAGLAVGLAMGVF